MGWIGFPLTESSDIWKYDFLKQFDKMRQEKWWGAGSCIWPRQSWAFFSGIVTGATATTITCSAATWSVNGTPPGTTYELPWNGTITADPSLAIPTSWTVAIGNDDPEKGVKSAILSWTSDTLTIVNISDYVTSKRIAAFTDLIGQEFWIMGTGIRATPWFELVMRSEWPNDYEFARGMVAEFHDDPDHPATVTNPTHTTIKDAEAHWKINEHVGKDFLVTADDTFLKRVTITANTVNTLTFATQTWTPGVGAAYSVIASGARAIPGRAPLFWATYYRGIQDPRPTHLPTDDTVGSAYIPLGTFHVPGPGGGACDGVDVDAVDKEIWTDFPLSPDDLICVTPPDHPYALDVHKTFRSIMVDLDEVTAAYVRATSKAGTSTRLLPFLSPAERYYIASTNAFTTTSTTVDSDNTISFGSIGALPYTPIRCHWAVRNPDGRYTSGVGILNSDTQLTCLQKDGFPVFADPGNVGKLMYISLGYTHWQKRMFRYLFDHVGIFVADEVFDGDLGESVAVDPPRVIDWDVSGPLGVGKFHKCPKSDKYLERHLRTLFFWSDSEGATYDGWDSFTTGDKAIYHGDSAFDPTVRDPLSPIDPTIALIPYYDYLYTGQLSAANQGRRDAQLSGRCSSGGTFWFRDEGADWSDFQYFSGVTHVESGTFDGGTTLYGTDSTKASGAASAWWNKAYRFFEYTCPYEFQVVEIKMTAGGWGDEDVVIEYRLISSGNDTDVKAGWAQALSATASGKDYRINELRKIARYAQRKCYLSSPSGTTYEVTIIGNGIDTQFFTPDVPEVIDERWSYGIREPRVGTLMKWDGSKWISIIKDEADAVRPGVTTTAPFHAPNPKVEENFPHYVRRYGYLTAGDQLGPDMFNQLKANGDVLRHAGAPLNWRNKPSEVGADNLNYNSPPGFGLTGHPDGTDWDDFLNDMVIPEWTDDLRNNSSLVMTPDGIPDYATTADAAPLCIVHWGATAHIDETEDGRCYLYGEARRYAYPFAPGVCHFNADYDFYTYADVVFSDAGDGTNEFFDGYGAVDNFPSVYFDTFGDPVLYRQWQLSSSVSTGPTHDNVYGDIVGAKGGDGLPVRPTSQTRPPDPVFPHPSWTSYKGYRIIDGFTIKRFDVVGGFTVID